MTRRKGLWALVGAAMVICITFGALLVTAADDAPWGSLDMARVREGLEAAGLSGVPENVIATLSTLEKVDDYPIYTMRYFGPYIRASELQAQYGSSATPAEKKSGFACSLFAAVGVAERAVFGRNFDWEYSPILVVFLEPEEGYRSVMSIDLAYLFDEETLGRLDTASVEELLPLLNAPFLTFDGMNEMGVAIGMASVDYECGYPSDPDKRDVGDLRLMREVLESSATVEEAIAFLDGINPVSQGGPNTHYLAADRTAAALIEYHGGEMYVFRSSEEAPWQLGTNFPVVLTEGHPQGNCWRYDQIEETLRENGGELSSSEAMALLQAVSTGMTQWSIVYDLADFTMSLVVGRGYDDLHVFSLSDGTWRAEKVDAGSLPAPQEPAGEEAGDHAEGDAAESHDPHGSEAVESAAALPLETWMKTYGDGQSDMGHDVLLLDDGGYLIVGETTREPEENPRLLLLRLDAAGDVVWQKAYTEDRASSGAAALAASDGGYVIAGTIQSDDGDDADICLLRIDEDGTEVWSRTFGTPRDEFGVRLLETADGGFVIVGNSVDPNDVVADPGAAGYAGFAGRSNAYVVRTNEEGHGIWSRRCDTEENVIASGGAIAADGGIVVLTYVLHYPIDDNDVRLVKLDGDGNEIWSQVWEEGDASGYDLYATRDGGYLISGVVSFPDDPARAKLDALVIKIDASGNEIWSTTYGEPGKIETAHAVTETFDGRYVCVGWQMRDFYTFADDILLAAFDRDGAPLWQDVTPSPAHNLHEAFVQHPDGSLVIAGSAARPGRPFRIQLIKTDLQGE